jgi:glycine/D-amino acid oxidase-like deaminating enzyme
VHVGQLDAKARTSGSKRSPDSISLEKRSQKAIGLLRAAGVPSDLDWVSTDSISSYEEMGDPSTTAQVHPYQFTTSMAELAEEKGVKVVYGSALSITKENDAVTGVVYKEKATGEEKTMQADTIVITAGPWTRTIWPAAPISALRAHSVTIKPTRPVSPYCLFTSIELPAGKGRRGKTVTPEIYARPNQEVYACGEGDTLIALPISSDLVVCDEARCQDIIDQVSSISDELRDGQVTARQACYLPQVSRGSGPLIGETGVKGLLMGAGHTCWGIQNGPGTGKLVSEFVFEGQAKSAKVQGLDPRVVL